jgi:hypothetical protein
MTNLDDTLLALVVTLVIVCAILGLQILLMRAKRRTVELQTAKAALNSHFEALDSIIHDPALPTSALEFLADFSELISKREACNGLIKALTTPETEKSPSVVAADVERLKKSRPDLVEGFNKALLHGLLAAFTRWPGNLSKLPQMVALFGDPKKDMQIASRFVRESHAYQDMRMLPA